MKGSIIPELIINQQGFWTLLIWIPDWIDDHHPVILFIQPLTMAHVHLSIEIVDLPIISMVIFHSYVKLPEGIKYPIWIDLSKFTNLN